MAPVNFKVYETVIQASGKGGHANATYRHAVAARCHSLSNYLDAQGESKLSAVVEF